VGDDEALAQAIEETLEHPPDPTVLKKAAVRYTLSTSAHRYLEVLGFGGRLSASPSTEDLALSDA